MTSYKQSELIDVTGHVDDVVRQLDIRNGIAAVFNSHDLEHSGQKHTESLLGQGVIKRLFRIAPLQDIHILRVVMRKVRVRVGELSNYRRQLDSFLHEPLETVIAGNANLEPADSRGIFLVMSDYSSRRDGRFIINGEQ